MELIPCVDLILQMEPIPVVELIPVNDMIPTFMILIPTYPHCGIGDSNSNSKKYWNHNTSSQNPFMQSLASHQPYVEPHGKVQILLQSTSDSNA